MTIMKLRWTRLFLNKVLLLIIGLQVATAFANNQSVANGAMAQVGKTLFYDPAYVVLSYPNGDVPLNRGVCSDVVIRAFRHAGIDLQKQVHVDMQANFNQYPKLWGLKRTDKNIDHRRVPNLEVWFKRQGKSLPITRDGKDYQAGDVVSWRLDNGLAHIGIVSNKLINGRRWVVHNIGEGARLEDVLFRWRIVGHYRYYNR